MMADENPIPPLCQCGCGKPTRQYPRTNNIYGHKKGAYMPFLLGHKVPSSYRQVSRTGEPGSIALHRLRAEAARGRPLPKGAVIHHPDRDVWNPNARLVVCDSQAYHRLLHARMRVKEAGGNPNTDRICAHCHKVKPIKEFMPNNCVTSRAEYSSNCRECNRILMRERYQRRKAHPSTSD